MVLENSYSSWHVIEEAPIYKLWYVYYLLHSAVKKDNITMIIKSILNGSSHLFVFPSLNGYLFTKQNLIEIFSSILNRLRMSYVGERNDHSNHYKRNISIMIGYRIKKIRYK